MFTIHGCFGRGCSQFLCSKSVVRLACCLNLAHSGTIERSRGASEHKKGDLGLQAWIVFLENIFCQCLATFGTTNMFCCFACLQVTISSDFGVQWLLDRCHLFSFCYGFGFDFDDFWCVWDRLEIESFSMAFRVGSQLNKCGRFVVIGLSLGPVAVSKKV